MNAIDRAEVVARLLRPRSIAVIGASADLSKINGRPLKHLLDKGYAGRILPTKEYMQRQHQLYRSLGESLNLIDAKM